MATQLEHQRIIKNAVPVAIRDGMDCCARVDAGDMMDWILATDLPPKIYSILCQWHNVAVDCDCYAHGTSTPFVRI